MAIQIHKPQTPGLEEDTSQAVISRRIFLRYVVGAVSSFIGIVAGVPILGYLASVFQAKEQAQWIRLGRIESFADPTPQVVQFTLTRQDGWLEAREARSCWVVSEGNTFVVFNGRCTHLGCAYHWQREGEHATHFFCPCHDGVYDRTGRVVDGPPPRSLDRLETRVEDGELLVLYQDFRPGVADRVPL